MKPEAYSGFMENCMKITNTTDIPLGLAVWILQDNYDYINQENYISVTQLMRPIRQIVLANRVKNKQDYDLVDRIPSALGNSLHDSIEKAWLTGHVKALRMLGYPESVIKRVLINPTPEELAATEEPIPVYLEQRTMREIDGFLVGGKYDMVAEGIVQDNKSTSAYSWVYGGRDDDYALQGSLYRWLNPKIITEDFIRINFIFTDWQKSAVAQNPNYPNSRCKAKDIPLLSLDDTEKWVKNKLIQVKKFQDAPQDMIPECTDEELWKSKTVFKYYSDPEKTGGRATKNFDELADAMAFKTSKGKGIVIPVHGEPKRCAYCPAYDACEQKDKYFLKE